MNKNKDMTERWNNDTKSAEINLLMKRWEKTRLLDKIPNEEAKRQTALLLENQRLFNESMDDNGWYAQFKRVSIPLVRRITPQLNMFNLASVQVMIKSTDRIEYFQKNKLVHEYVTASTKKMKAIWNYNINQDLRHQFNLDAEAELTAILAQELTLELDRMFLLTIRNSASLAKEIDFGRLCGDSITDKYASLQDQIYDLGMESKQLYGRPFPNWIVASRDLCDVLNPTGKNDDIFTHSLGIDKHSTLTTDESEITLYADPLAGNYIIMGYKGDHPNDSGYVFAPLSLVQLTPVVLDPESFMPRRGILCRYAHKVVDPTYYSVLTVKNFKKEKQPQGCLQTTFGHTMQLTDHE